MDKLYGRLLSGLNALASIWIIAIMLLITADVVGRAAFNNPLFGVPEIVKVSVVGIVWLQMAFTLRADRHLRSHLVFNLLPVRGKRILYGVNCIFGAAIFGIIVFYTYDDVIKTFLRGTFEGEHPVRVPVWPIWAILVGGALLTAVEYAIQFAKTVASDSSAAIADHGEDDASFTDADATSGSD